MESMGQPSFHKIYIDLCQGKDHLVYTKCVLLIYTYLKNIKSLIMSKKPNIMTVKSPSE